MWYQFRRSSWKRRYWPRKEMAKRGSLPSSIRKDQPRTMVKIFPQSDAGKHKRTVHISASCNYSLKPVTIADLLPVAGNLVRNFDTLGCCSSLLHKTMVVIFLGALGRREMSRESSSSPWTSDTRAHSTSHAKISTGDPPPPYNTSACDTESEGKEPAAISTGSGQAKSDFFASLWRRIVLRHAPASVRRRALKQDPWLPVSPLCTILALDREDQLQRYLLEIIGFTFGVNFDELNTDYYSRTVSEKTTSMLSPSEQAELLHISKTINDLLKEQSRNALNTVPLAPKQEINDNVLISAPFSSEAYTLDLLATYAHHQCNPCCWNHTLVGYWARNPENRPVRMRNDDWKDTLSTHAHFIAVISPNEKVQLLLGKALVKYQEEMGLKLKRESAYFGHTREKATHLVTALRNHVGRSDRFGRRW
jgi:hypothetical protein